MKHFVQILVTLGLAIFSFNLNAQEETDPGNRLILILDASGSMWGQIDGVNKIVIARQSLDGLIDTLAEDSEVGLIAYGHRREGDCEDIEVLLEPSSLDRELLKSTVNAIKPKGKTPITASINTAVGLVGSSESSSIVLISDGLETCDMDPCAAVTAAKQSGVPFVLHVVGFDVAGEDTTQLECAAQAGEGLYIAADDAASLSEALVTAYQKPTIPDGRLVIGATAEGQLQDATIRVRDANTNEEVAGARTYVSGETNPRSIPLEDGDYRVEVSAVNIKGSMTHEFDISIRDGSREQRDFDFSRGTLVVGVTRNSQLSDATVFAFTQDGKQVDGGRTYKQATSNPLRLDLAAGTYDVVIKGIEIEGAPEQRIEDVEVRGGEEAWLAHEFASGTLRVKVVRGDGLIDAVVQVYDDEGSVGGARAYADPERNPVDFELLPGNYRLRIREVRGERIEQEVSVRAEQVNELLVDLGMESGIE